MRKSVPCGDSSADAGGGCLAIRLSTATIRRRHPRNTTMGCDHDERAYWLADRILPHEPALRRWLHRLTSARIEVDDVVQETYGVLSALGNVSHIRDPRAYLFTTARSILLQQVRRARIVQIESVAEIEAMIIHQDESPVESAVSDHQQLSLLAEQIARLPGKCREAFVLRKIHGCSQREIATRMGISENTVEKHIGKGLRLLMRAMAVEAPAAKQRGDGPARQGLLRRPRNGEQA
ncbi:RNA polymerase sigma factor [Luteimonas salinilitoris]|uniref:RNA polymerase sigma factor n=1 Tax=Luteimonas salinilitoris TaxID=3237697 RepID=A0ABV4HSM8_9GAMM